jgi:hypothetical protein
VLQPGDVIEAQVLALVDAGKVRIALANTIMEVATQVPLVPGTTVQLAVKGTGAELALVLVDKGTAPVGGSPGSPSPVPFTAVGGRAQGVTTTDAPTLQASIPVTDPEQAVGQPVRPAAAALAQAVRTAAAQQGGLAPLFADAAVAAESGTLPRPVQQAVARLLALQTPSAAPLTGADVKQAFVRSGLFLESSLGAAATVPGAARGAPTPAATGPGAPQQAVPVDLKAALLVLRQVLSTWLDGAAAAPQNGAPPAALPRADTPLPNATRPPDAPVAPKGAAPEIPAAARNATAAPAIPRDLPTAAAPGNAPLVAALLRDASALGPLLLAALNQDASLRGDATTSATAIKAEPAADAHPAPAPARPLSPPPPYRGAPTSAQPPAAASIGGSAEPQDIGARLLTETDASLARQTLLQAASLPDGADRVQRDPTTARWNFEIPLATPQGTAVAQFEIARDARSTKPDEPKVVWRARFTLDMEPMGPVHALIALNGTRTAVTLWAERDASAARLRADAPLLAEALQLAELEPGDVQVRSGEPPRPRPAGAGKFLDRAS